jgi:hypothetical protein
MRRDYTPDGDSGETLAGFGGARLVKYLDGRVELPGGTEDERERALAWLAQFMPRVRLGVPSPDLWPRRR